MGMDWVGAESIGALQLSRPPILFETPHEERIPANLELQDMGLSALVFFEFQERKEPQNLQTSNYGEML